MIIFFKVTAESSIYYKTTNCAFNWTITYLNYQHNTWYFYDKKYKIVKNQNCFKSLAPPTEKYFWKKSCIEARHARSWLEFIAWQEIAFFNFLRLFTSSSLLDRAICQIWKALVFKTNFALSVFRNGIC